MGQGFLVKLTTNKCQFLVLITKSNQCRKQDSGWKKNTQPAVRNLAAGDVLFREGEVGDYAYQIVKGKIEVCKFNGDEYVTLSILEKGALNA